MKERSYTVAEIDRMRGAIEHEWLYGCRISDFLSDPNETTLFSRTYMAEEKTKCVEEQLRTYMLGGIDPEELE